MSTPRWPVDPFEVSIEPRWLPRDLPRKARRGGTADGSASQRQAGPTTGNELATLARGGFLTLVGSVASSVFGFLLIVVITRGLHPASSAGVLLEAIALFMILSNTAELGADTGLVRMVASYRTDRRAQDLRRLITVALWPVLFIGAAIAVIVFAYAPQLSRLFIHGTSTRAGIRYIQLFAPFLPLATLTTVALSGTRGFGTMVPYVAIQNVAVPVLRPLLIPFVLAAGLGAFAVGLAWAIPMAVGFVFALGSLLRLLRRAERRESRVPGSPRRVGDLASEFWRFSAPRGLAGLLQIAVIWLDVLLIGALRTTREAGIYAATSRFVGVGTFALQAMGIAIAPQIASLLRTRDHEGAETLFQTGTWWLMVLAWPMYATLAAFAPFLLRIFGHDYVAGQTALLVLSLAMLSLVGTGNNKIVMLMGGKSAWNLAITAGSLALNIGLNFTLIPPYGMNGAAVAFAASIVFDNAATMLVVWRKLHLNPFGRGYWVVAFGAVGCYGLLGLAVRYGLGMSVPIFMGFGVVATALYVALLWKYRGLLRLPELRAALRMGPGRLPRSLGMARWGKGPG